MVGLWLSVTRSDNGGGEFAQALCHTVEFSTHAVALYHVYVTCFIYLLALAFKINNDIDIDINIDVPGSRFQRGTGQSKPPRRLRPQCWPISHPQGIPQQLLVLYIVMT